MLTLLLKSKDIYKIDAVANRISLALPYEHQMEIDPTAVQIDSSTASAEIDDNPYYTFPIRFGNKEDVNVEFVIMLDDESVFKTPSEIAVSTVQKVKTNTAHRPSLKDTDLLGVNPHLN